MVTGAAGHLGRAVARRFAEEGANLVLVARDLADVEHVAEPSASPALLLKADLLAPEQVHAAVEAAIDRFGRVDVLCNLAGAFRMGDEVHRTPTTTWDLLIDRNVRTLVHAARAVVPRMIEAGGGKIVNIGALASQKGVARMGAYVVAKDAVVRLTETMAAELRAHRINVNCVLPSIIATPENRAAMPSADPTLWVQTKELADVVLFLASEQARAVHGAAVPVTGLS